MEDKEQALPPEEKPVKPDTDTLPTPKVASKPVPRVKAQENAIKPVDAQPAAEATNDYIKSQFLDLAKNSINKEGTASEQGKELLNLASMAGLLSNADFLEEYQKQQQTLVINDLKSTGKAEAIKNAAKKQEARNQRNTALYGAFKPFFEGFMHQKDAFGLIPMLICIFVFFPIYLIITLVLGTVRYFLEKIDDVFAALAHFTKPARYIAGTAVIIALAGAIIVGMLYGLQLIFGWSIL